MGTKLKHNKLTENKENKFYCRMDDAMISKLRIIRQQTGISMSETIREAVRRLLHEIEKTGSINLKIK
jgi:hypothetical protein